MAPRARFAIVDAAMNDLIRPTLYDAWHDILPVAQFSADAGHEPYDIVGPICGKQRHFRGAKAPCHRWPPMTCSRFVHQAPMAR